MDKIRTVSDSKKSFYQNHHRPINSVYRQVVEELLVEMHLLSVNQSFVAEPVYYLGVVTAFERFMMGYQPDKDRDSIFNALCTAINSNPQHYQDQAAQLKHKLESLTLEEFLSQVTQEDGASLDFVAEIKRHPTFKYSRLFAIGMFTVLEQIGGDQIKDKESLEKTVNDIATGLGLPVDKMSKDIELYKSNLEKIEQMLLLIEETIASDRKKREKRAADALNLEKKAEDAPGAAETPESQADTPEATETPSN